MARTGEESSKVQEKNVLIKGGNFLRAENFGKSSRKGKHYKYNDEYTSLVSRTCKCGHVLNIYNRYRREICSYCGAMVFLTPKDEFMYKMKRKCVK